MTTDTRGAPVFTSPPHDRLAQTLREAQTANLLLRPLYAERAMEQAHALLLVMVAEIEALKRQAGT